MRLLAAVYPFLPSAEPGIILGNIIVPAIAETEFLINSLRDFSLLIFNLLN
jgi:hypothetical protein